MLWLEFEDASCTEAWFNLRLNNLPKPVRVDVYRENYLTKSFTISTTNDTIFYIENLLPKRRYDVYVKVRGSDGKEYTSAKVNFETMDTTSHEFTWQIFEFGEKGNSVLYDVAIIDENNIWAVGEIYTKDTYTYDSLGNWIQPYNAVHWDGTKWELKRIYFPSVCGGTSLSSYPAKAIFIFDDGQIWISSSGDKIAILKDGIQINKFCLPSNVSMSINKLWGSTSEDLYAVGNNGNIAHWDGRKWTKIESGTDIHLNSITKGIDTTEVYISGYDNGKSILLKVKNKKDVNKINDLENIPIYSLATGTNYLFVKTNNAIYRKYLKANVGYKYVIFNSIYDGVINSDSYNNLIDAGIRGNIYHFNGYTHTLIGNPLQNQSYLIFGLAIKNNLVAITGINNYGIYNNRAFLLLGRRLNK
ncbi:MAG: glucosyl transferase [Ignavibacteria bacterium]|nr:glucosyl transferase [Ignavibacteria bacterium]